MSLLCRIGLHKWREIGCSGFVMQWSIQQCQRCKHGREVGFTVTFHYTPAEMEAALQKEPK